MFGNLIGLIEWPSDAAAYPSLILGAETVEQLDRQFVRTLRLRLGDPTPGDRPSGNELWDFVGENGWPADDASDSEILDWLRRMRTDGISTCCLIYVVSEISGQPYPEGHEHEARYMEGTD